MDALGEAGLEDLGLQAPLHKVLELEREHVVEAHARLVEHADPDQPTDQRVALEQPLRVLLVELEQLTRRATDLGQREGDPPDLPLVPQAVLARELELGVETGRWAGSGLLDMTEAARGGCSGRERHVQRANAPSYGRRGTLYTFDLLRATDGMLRRGSAQFRQEQ